MNSAQISEMSSREKLQLMDALWDDLSTTTEQFEPPTWHGEELKRTEARRELGLEEPMTLEEARNRLFPKKNDS
ncbi:MAG: addiction module protein [Lentimonas sp.]